MGCVDVCQEDVDDVIFPSDDVHGDEEAGQLQQEDSAAFIGSGDKHSLDRVLQVLGREQLGARPFCFSTGVQL